MAADRHQSAVPLECGAIRSLLGPDLDKQTPEIAAHLAGCPACRSEARRLDAAWTLLNFWEPLDPSPHFARGIWARIRADRSVPSRGWDGPSVRSIRWAVSGLAVVLAAVLPVLVWHQDRPERPELVAQLDLMESREFLSDYDVVENLDVLLLVDDP